MPGPGAVCPWQEAGTAPCRGAGRSPVPEKFSTDQTALRAFLKGKLRCFLPQKVLSPLAAKAVCRFFLRRLFAAALTGALPLHPATFEKVDETFNILLSEVMRYV